MLSKDWLDKEVLLLSKQEWPKLVRGLNIVIDDGNESENSAERQQVNSNIFQDNNTIDLKVKSLKGNRLSAKTKIKSRGSKSPISHGRKTDMTSELDMFNSNI